MIGCHRTNQASSHVVDSVTLLCTTPATSHNKKPQITKKFATSILSMTSCTPPPETGSTSSLDLPSNLASRSRKRAISSCIPSNSSPSVARRRTLVRFPFGIASDLQTRDVRFGTVSDGTLALLEWRAAFGRALPRCFHMAHVDPILYEHIDTIPLDRIPGKNLLPFRIGWCTTRRTGSRRRGKDGNRWRSVGSNAMDTVQHDQKGSESDEVESIQDANRTWRQMGDCTQQSYRGKATEIQSVAQRRRRREVCLRLFLSNVVSSTDIPAVQLASASVDVFREK